ncbi:MAG: universal stress protein [Nitrososphaeraceae archaeon]
MLKLQAETRGRSKLKSILLGSVAMDVVRHAHRPAVTVKQ